MFVAKIQRVGEFGVMFKCWNRAVAWGVIHHLKAGKAAAFGLVGINRESFIISAARVCHMIFAAAKRAFIKCINHIKNKR